MDEVLYYTLMLFYGRADLSISESEASGIRINIQEIVHSASIIVVYLVCVCISTEYQLSIGSCSTVGSVALFASTTLPPCLAAQPAPCRMTITYL